MSLSSSRPDIVLVSSDHIILMELLVVTNREEHFAAASSRKVTCYGPLLSDLECSGLLVNLVTIEVGCFGHFLPSTVSNLCRVCHLQKFAVIDPCSNNSKSPIKLPFRAPIGHSMSDHQSYGILRIFLLFCN